MLFPLDKNNVNLKGNANVNLKCKFKRKTFVKKKKKY